MVKDATRQRRRQEFDPCSGKIPHATGQLSRIYWACALEPGICKYWSPQARKSAPGNERPPQRGACAPQLEGSLHSPQLQESPRSKGDSARPEERKYQNQHVHSQCHQHKILSDKLNKREANSHSKTLCWKFFFNSNRQENITCSWIRRQDTVKMAIHSELM